MWRKQVITAVFVYVIGGAIANADLILTVNGLNPINSPLMIEGIGPLLVAVAGNTPLEANDVSVAATGGILTPLSDANHRYNFEFNDEDESTFGNAFLIASNDISIEGKTIPAGTTICQLYFFCDRESNIISVLYAGLADLISLEEEESEQGESLVEDSAKPTVESAEETPSEPQTQPMIDYNAYAESSGAGEAKSPAQLSQ